MSNKSIRSIKSFKYPKPARQVAKVDEVTALPAVLPDIKTIDQSFLLDSVMTTMFESIDRSAMDTIEQKITDFLKAETREGPSDITKIKINLIGQMIRMGARYEDIEEYIQPVIYQNLEFQDIKMGSPFFTENESEIRRVSSLLAPQNQGQYQVKVQPMIINDDDYTRVFNELIKIINDNNIYIPNSGKFKKLPTQENRPISIDDYLVTIDRIIANKMISDPLYFLLYNIDKYNGYIDSHYINKQNPIYNQVDNSFRHINPENGFTDIKPILQRVMMFKSFFFFLSSSIIIDNPDFSYFYLHCLIILKNLIPVIMELKGRDLSRQSLYDKLRVKIGGKSRNKRGNKKTNRRKTIRRRKNKNNRHKTIRRKER